jgi:hypothetical protein
MQRVTDHAAMQQILHRGTGSGEGFCDDRLHAFGERGEFRVPA